MEPLEPRRHLAFAAVSLGTFMSTLDAGVVNVALPTLAVELQSDLAHLEWVVLSYLLALAALLLNAGRLSDVWGRRQVYATGLVIFGVASGGCALAESVGGLTGARVVQGIGGAMMNAAGPAILTAVYPASQRGRVLGLVGLSVSAGLAAGPAIGGIVIQALSWRWLFLPNIPLALFAALVTWRAVPPVREARRAPFDWAGSILLAAALGALLLLLSHGIQWGLSDPRTFGLAAAALLLGAIFVAVERNVEGPIVDLALFRNRVFTGSAVAGLLIFVTIGAINLVMPFYLTEAHGLSTRQMGLVLSALPLVLAGISPVSGWRADRAGSTAGLAAAGGFLAAAVLLLLSRVSDVASPLGIAGCLGGLGLAVGIFQSPNNSALMGSVPRERLGTAGGLLATVRVTGLLVGNAVGGAVFLAVGDIGSNGATAARGLELAALIGVATGLGAAAASLTRRGPAPR